MVILRKMEPVKKVCRIFYKGITIFYHMGDLDYRFLPFKRAYADYGISSRVRHFQQKNCKLQQFFSEVLHCRSYHLPPPFTYSTVCKGGFFVFKLPILQRFFHLAEKRWKDWLCSTNIPQFAHICGKSPSTMSDNSNRSQAYLI